MRTAVIAAAALLLLLSAPPAPSAAGGRLFTVVQGKGMICEIDPTTGGEIFSFYTVGTGVHPGLAFNNVELFYTDETLGVVKVYLPDGTFLRDIAKPGVGPTAGAGLGVSAASLFGVGVGDQMITAVSPLDGSFQSSVFVNESKEALTFAGSRGTMFVRVGNSNQIAEVLPDGTVVNTITVPINVTGLAFSSALNRLFAVVTGLLYGFDPDTGAVLPGYPVSITGYDGYHVAKTGAAAADEVFVPESCGDQEVNGERETCDPPGATLPNGRTCRDDCTYCGDAILDAGEACDAGTANSDTAPGACRTDCTLPRCGDGVLDPQEACDDGNTADGDGCNRDCEVERCGDGVVNVAGETCEPPNTTLQNGRTCRANCTYCGDGVQDAGEACDQGAGNSDTTPDACRTDCTLPVCGDGVVDEGEACDDGNDVDSDGCSNACLAEQCGDGIIQAARGEECDPPSVGACDAECHLIELCHNQVDDDHDGLIDCEDPRCACLPIEKDPGVIRFGPAGAGEDYFTVHGSFNPASTMDPSTESVGVLLTNATGILFSADLAGGAVHQVGRQKFRFRDNAAKLAHSGLWSLEIRWRPGRGYVFRAKAYDDLAAATEALMTVQFHVGDDAFMNSSEWQQTSRGWKLELPGE
jgi:cysteine-rich repeat protein